MLGCQNRKKPFKLSPGSTTSGDNGKHASYASTQHVSKVAKVGFHIVIIVVKRNIIGHNNVVIT